MENIPIVKLIPHTSHLGPEWRVFHMLALLVSILMA